MKFVFGKYLGKAVGFFDRFGDLARLVLLRIPPERRRPRCFDPNPVGAPFPWRWRSGRPLPSSPSCPSAKPSRGCLWNLLAEGRKAAKHPGIATGRFLGPSHPQGAEAARGKFLHRLLDRAVEPDWRRRPVPALLALRLLSPETEPLSGPATMASVRLCTGSKGWKCNDLVFVQLRRLLQTAQDREVDRVWLSTREARAAARMSSGRVTPLMQKGSPKLNLFCVSVPVLSEQSTSIPASSSIAARCVTIACFSASFRAPTAMVTESTAGMATGTAATVKTKANCNVVSMLSPRNKATARIKIDESKSNDNQEVANLQNRSLKMADGVGRLHQTRGLAKIGALAGAVDQGVGLALLDDRTRVDRLALVCVPQAAIRQSVRIDRLRSGRREAGVHPPERFRPCGHASSRRAPTPGRGWLSILRRV